MDIERETECRKAKRTAPSLSQKPPVIYMVLTHPPSHKYNYSLYALKAENGPSKPLPEPLFRCNNKYFPMYPGVGAVDSKIYIFGGMRSYRSPKGQHVFDTYVFDTAKPLPPPSARVNPNKFLSKGPKLNHPKLDPIVITFDGKIFVFPSVMGSDEFNTCEVLDVQTNVWKELQEIPVHYNQRADEDVYPVQAYMVHNSTFVAYISEGIYCLDLLYPKKWRTQFGAVKTLPFHGEGILVDGKCFALSYQALEKFDLVEGLVDGLVKGFRKHEELSDLIPDSDPLCYCGLNLFKNGKLCLVTHDKFANPYFGAKDCCTIGFHIFQVGENETKKRKKSHQSGIHLLSSSSFTMPDTKEFSGYGRPIACFAMHK